MRLCTIEGCGQPAKAKGLCSRHRMRLWRYGDPLAGGAYLDWRNRWRRIRLGDGVAYVTLTKGYVAVIDAADFAKVSQHLWQAVTNRSGGVYARTTIEGRSLSLHRLILGVPESVNVDHKDGDGLNCRRSNMRSASQARNCQNQRLNRRSTSGYKGVSWQSDRRRWQAGIKINGKRIALGRFDTAEQAARAYDDAARRLFGEFACVNFPQGNERPARLGGQS